MSRYSTSLAWLIPVLSDLVHVLVTKDYARLEGSGLIGIPEDGRRTSPQEVEEVIAEYARYIATKVGPSAEEIDRILAEHGRWQPNTSNATLIDVPVEAFAHMWTVIRDDEATHLTPIDLSMPTIEPQAPLEGQTIAFDLWTAEEGRSDLNMHVIVPGDPEQPAQLAYLQAFPLALIPPLQDLIRDLAAGDYAGLAAANRVVDSSLTPTLIEEAITGYRDRVLGNIECWASDPSQSAPLPHLIPMPVHAFRYARAYPAAAADVVNAQWAVDVELWWSDAEFPRDLTLKALVETSPTGLVARLEDLDVL